MTPAIRAAKDHRPLREVKYARGKIRELRAVPAFQKSRAWEADAEQIYQAHGSGDFETFYPVVPMKEMPRTYLAAFRLSAGELARAPWLTQKLREITA